MTVTSAVRPRALAPVVATDRASLAAALAPLRAGGRPVALVPTMGALHAGHRALFARAGAGGAAVVATVFVNPLQFAPGEDLDRYPRTFDADLAACAEEGVAAVFAPTAATLYGDGAQVTVAAGPLGGGYEGADRPGHFDGVLTVVTKLLNLVRPDVAVFGEKDYQQLALIRLLVRDLELGVRIVGHPTVRESDGLALSSRNRFLTPEQRREALAIPRALAAPHLAAARAVLAAEPGLDVAYCELVDPVTLAPTPHAQSGRLLVAARAGTTRLIDNAGFPAAAPASDSVTVAP